jgi:hypothetical protein
MRVHGGPHPNHKQRNNGDRDQVSGTVGDKEPGFPRVSQDEEDQEQTEEDISPPVCAGN